MKINTRANIGPKNHEGIAAAPLTHEQELRRTVMACLLWEETFYENGEDAAERIRKLVTECKPAFVAELAVKARTDMKLRHVPLLLVREMARVPGHKALVAETLATVIQRPDELTEFLAIYWKERRQPLSAQVKKGLAAAFGKFSEHSLAKYDREGPVKLRDVLFLSHAKPKGAEKRYTKLERRTAPREKLADGEALYKRIVDRELETPDTWEVGLSAGDDRKETFERLMEEKKLGALAFLRNLRNMEQAGIAKTAVSRYIESVDLGRVLPFRFIAAARAVPKWEDVIEAGMLRALADAPKLAGKTVLLVDTSPSMYGVKVSRKSELDRADAAFALAILLREICADVEIVAFSSEVKSVPPRRGFALADAIKKAVPSNGTLLGNAVRAVSGRYDRLIVITDEQSQDAVRDPDPGTRSYMLNVATYKNGIGYGKWVRIDGWSEAVIEYLRAYEADTVLKDLVKIR
jgi:hypothetical protein